MDQGAVAIITGALTSAATLGAVWIKNRVTNKVAKQDQAINSWRELYETVKSDRDKLEEKLEKEIGELRQSLQEEKLRGQQERELLTQQIQLVREESLHQKSLARELSIQLANASMIDVFPFPAWEKDENHVMKKLNRPYEHIFLSPSGKSASDYIGNDDFAIWPNHIAKAYRRHDESVVLGTLPYYVGFEPLKVEGEDITKTYMIVKYRHNTGRGIGTKGFAIPLDLIERRREFQDLKQG